MKLLIIIALIFSINANSQEGMSRTLDISTGGGRLLDDISTGGGRVAGGIELLKLERIEGTSKYELKNARPTVERFLGTSLRIDAAVKMLKLKVMTDFENISEITLKDGTVIKAEEILKGE